MRRHRLLLAAVAVAASLAGCAREQWVYDKPSATPAQVDRDLAACRKESTSAQKIGITPEDRVDRAAFNRCMERRGYSIRKMGGPDKAPSTPQRSGHPGRAGAPLWLARGN